MNEKNLSLSYTCSVCENICDEDELQSHLCLEGYHHIYVDENFFFYPQCDDGQIIRKNLVDGAEAIMMDTQVPQADVASDWRKHKVMEEKYLIAKVHKRPALWNFKLPLSQRSQQVKKKLWEEIAVSMNKTMDVPTIKKKWKSLCDSFRIHHKNKQRQLNGSAGRTSRENWVHYEQLQFLCDVQLENETATNIPATKEGEECYRFDDGDNDNDANDSNESNISDVNNVSSRGSCNRKSCSTDDRSVDEIVNAIRQPVTINMPSLIPPPQTDKATAIANLIAIQLREVQPQLLDKLTLKLLQTINDAKEGNL